MILAATWNRYQLDHVEQAIKIQLLDDKRRNHDDRTDKHHTEILGGAVNEDDDRLPGYEEQLENNEDLDALATAPEEKAKSTRGHSKQIPP